MRSVRGTSRGMYVALDRKYPGANLDTACSFAFLEGKAFRHGDIVSLSGTLAFWAPLSIGMFVLTQRRKTR